MARKAGDLGLFGAWLNPRYPDRQRIEFAAELEDLGFRTIWLGVDHVGIQVVASPGETPMADFRVLAGQLRAAAAG